FNDEEIGALEGENNLWRLNEFEIPIEKVRFPERAPLGSTPTGARNEIRVEIDTDNPGDTWCTAVNWSSLSFKAVSPIILIHGNNSNGGFFERRGFTGELERMKLLFDDSINFVPAAAPISVNGQKLDGFIPNIARSFGVDSVHLVAHSKGGLDAREYLALYHPARENDLAILSYTTLSTPHNGSAGSDLLVRRKQALAQFAELDFDGFPFFTEQVLNELPTADAGEEDMVTWLTAAFNARNLPALVSSRTIINTVAADADRSGNEKIDNNPDEYLEIRQESEVVANLFALDPLRALIGVDTSYQVLRRVANVSIDFDERRKLGIGARRTVAVLIANPNPQELGNDILVTISSAQAQGSLPADRTRNTEVFQGKAEARNHASVANAGVAQVVGPWIIAAEKEVGDLK
ncbi:MAG: esterase/lipase family protein, partial [Vicinamibacteria bacterium]